MTAAAAEVLEIAEPGVYEMSNDVYHADPVPGGSLSCSGARKLLPPYCPAIYAYERVHGRPDTRAYDIGHAAHDAVLGCGPEVVAVDAADWRTKAAKEQAEAARVRGAVPLLAAEYQTVQDMAAALRAHPFAGAIFQAGTGTPEASLFWVDELSGVWRRARLDWLPDGAGKRFIIADYKTALSANPEKFARTAVDYGYAMQHAWYCDAVTELGLADDPLFVFVVQEKTPPHLISVVQMDTTAARIGQLLNRQAINTYAECTRTGTWPSYADDVVLASLPRWYERTFEL